MYTEERARELVIEAGLKLVEKGLVARTWGNVSARCGKNEMIITPSGIAYTNLKPSDLVKVDIKSLEYEGDIKPSSEKGIHAAVYEMRSDINFVIHTHQTFASALAAEEADLPFAPCAKYGLPGTEKLRENVIRTISDHMGHKKFLLAKHGALLLGENMEEAFELADLLEIDCREQFATRIPSLDSTTLKKIELDKYRTKPMPFVKLVQNELIAECLHAGVTIRPYLDDFAQMVGSDMKIVENRDIDIMRCLIARQAVLIKGVGALCVGRTEDDCEAAATIVTKNCAAACYVRNASPISRADSVLQRVVYLTKYSKKKNG